MRDLTFENSSFMSLATTFSLWSMQCVIHGSCNVCAHRDTFWPGYIMFTEKIVDHFENLWTFFLPPGSSCLQNRNSSCISFWSTNHKKAKSWVSFDTSVDSSNCSGKKSAFGSFATSSALTSADNSSIGRALGCFSFFLHTHPSQKLFCTYH